MGIVSEAERTERKRRHNRQYAFNRSMLQMAELIQSGFSAGDLLFSMEFFGVSGPVLCAPGSGPAGPLCRVLLNYTVEEDSKIILCSWVSDKISVARLEHPVYPQEVGARVIRRHPEKKNKKKIKKLTMW